MCGKLNASCIAILQGHEGDAQAIGHRHLGGCYGRLGRADFVSLIVHAEWACLPITLTSCRLGTIMKYRIRSNGVSVPCSTPTVPLTRYVIRVREMRQNVEFLQKFSRSRSHHFIGRYGRFSKSIRPDEVGACYRVLMRCDFSDTSFLSVCGACKIGTLHPLFAVRTKTPRKTVNSQMAARSPRGAFLSSLCSVPLFPYYHLTCISCQTLHKRWD